MSNYSVASSGMGAPTARTAHDAHPEPADELEAYDDAVIGPLCRAVRDVLGATVANQLVPAIAAQARSSAFSAGVVAGVGEAVVMSAVDLVVLLADLVLAEMYETEERGFFERVWRATLPGAIQAAWNDDGDVGDVLIAMHPLGLPARLVGSELLDEAFLKQAHERREALFAIIEHAVNNPGDVLGAMADDYVKRWEEMTRLLESSQVADRFEAGRMFGPMLLDIIGLLTGVGGLARFAATAPKKVTDAVKLLGRSLEDIGEQRRRATPPDSGPQGALTDQGSSGAGTGANGAAGEGGGAPNTPAKIADGGTGAAPVSNGAGGGARAASADAGEAKKAAATVDDDSPPANAGDSTDAADRPPVDANNQRAEPVNVVTGEEELTLVDATVPGLVPLSFARIYTSGLAGRGEGSALGAGWSHSYGERLEVTAGERGAITLVDATGRRIPFRSLLPGQHTRHVREDLTLERDATGRYSLRRADRSRMLFKAADDGASSRVGTAVHRLSEVHDRNGNAARIDYPSTDAGDGGALWCIRGPSGRGLALVASGQAGAAVRTLQLHRILDDGTRDESPVATYTVDAAGQLVQFTDASGEGEHYTYTRQSGSSGALSLGHLLHTRTTAVGMTYHFEWQTAFDATGTPVARCTRSRAEDGSYDTRFVYGAAGATGHRTTIVTDSRGGTEHFTLSADGQVTRHVDAGGALTINEYSATGKLLRRRREGAETRFTYDMTGGITGDGAERLASVTNALGHTHTVSYDAAGHPVRLTDPLGHSSGRHHDAHGNVVRMADAQGAETVIRRDRRGLPVRIVRPGGAVERLHWNDAGELAAVNDPRGATTRYTYYTSGSAQGLVETVSVDARGVARTTTRYDYDACGRLTSITAGDGATTWLAYDAAGQLTRHIDPSGRRTEYAYDDRFAQVTRRTDPDGSTFRYEYDSERNLTALINQNGERYTLEYDAAERLTREVGFDGREQRYHYDAAGHLIRHDDAPDVDGTPRYTTFGRDALGRLLDKTSSDGQRAFFAYDALGRLSRADNHARHLGFEYDACGRLVAEHQHEPQGETGGAEMHALHTLRHAYDRGGLRTRTVLPGGRQIDYRYDEAGALSAMSVDGEALTRIERDALGRTTQQSHGAADAVTTAYDYDPAGRLTRQCSASAHSRNPLLERRYGYDAAGNLATIEDLKGTTTYRYDPLERITAVAGSGAGKFAFDPAGNLLGTEASSTSGGYVEGNRLKMLGDRHFEYDPAGNLVAERRGTAQRQVTEYRYDHGNTLRSVTTPDGKTTGFDYDALGRRTRKTADQSGAEATTQYWWNGDQLLAERRRSGGGEGEQVTYLHAPGSFVPVAQLRTPGHAAQAADGASLPVDESETSHYLVDQIGTPQALVNAHGETVWEASYTLHGAVRALHAAAVDNPIRFQGQYADEETGLHYNRFRYYHPGTGRFVNQDPIGLDGGANLYRYAPNPTGWVDPLGLKCKEGALAHFVDDAEVGDGLSGVYDPGSGEMTLAPSSADFPRPFGHVPRRGGHAILSSEIGGVPSEHRAFTAFKTESGDLEVEWLSRGVNGRNPAFEGSELPENLQGDVLKALEHATGKSARSRGP